MPTYRTLANTLEEVTGDEAALQNMAWPNGAIQRAQCAAANAWLASLPANLLEMALDFYTGGLDNAGGTSQLWELTGFALDSWLEDGPFQAIVDAYWAANPSD